LKDGEGDLQPFSVRQRSPWKDGFDLDDLTDHKDFTEFMSQVAIATATSHVRGTVGKTPGQFKNVIKALMDKKWQRDAWGDRVFHLASAYHEQVLLDYKCFHAFVTTNYH
jgi:hypothetical protein